jgi:hypothetical protein
MAGRAEHDPIARRLTEPCVRRPILRTEIGLDLDDPRDPPAGRVVANETRADEQASGIERGACEGRSPDDGQRNG